MNLTQAIIKKSLKRVDFGVLDFFLYLYSTRDFHAPLKLLRNG